MSKKIVSVSIQDALRKAAGAFAGEFTKVLIAAFKDADPAEILRLFGKEMPDQESRPCKKNCGAPEAVGGLCIVHFVARFLNVDLMVAVAMLNGKKIELPEQWATDRAVKKTVANLQSGKPAKAPEADDETADQDRPLTSKLWPQAGMIKLDNALKAAQEDYKGVTLEAMQEAMKSGKIKTKHGGQTPYAHSVKLWLKENFQRK